MYINIYTYIYIYILILYIYICTWISNHFPKDSFPLIESTHGPVGTSARPPELPTQRGKRSTTIGERMQGYDLRMMAMTIPYQYGENHRKTVGKWWFNGI